VVLQPRDIVFVPSPKNSKNPLQQLTSLFSVGRLFGLGF